MKLCLPTRSFLVAASFSPSLQLFCRNFLLSPMLSPSPANATADEHLKPTPFLLVTAEALKDNVVEAVKAGVNNYVVKPFTAETLREKIDAIFKE